MRLGIHPRSLGRRVLAAPISSRVAPASRRESLARNHFLVKQCLHWPVPAAILRWTFRTSRRGRSSDKDLGVV
jgi:hypothetical protein